MGNSSSSTSTAPNTYLQDADLYRVKNPKLSDNDIKTYNISKSNYFKGTIAVCAIYGVFALFMLLIIMFSEKGSSFLSNDFQAFSLTFIGGLVFVITLLVASIMSFKPKILQPSPYDQDMCPDYWKLVPETEQVLDSYESDNSKTSADVDLLQYKCVPDTSVWNAKADKEVNKGNTQEKLFFTSVDGKDSVSIDSAFGKVTNNKSMLQCSSVYPNYVAMKSLQDKVNNPDGDVNLYACQYASTCDIPWTSACPQP